MQPGLENYTFLTCDILIERANVVAGLKGQNLATFSNNLQFTPDPTRTSAASQCVTRDTG